jgi:hypothetical protein
MLSIKISVRCDKAAWLQVGLLTSFNVGLVALLFAFLPQADAQQNVQSSIQSLAPTVLRGASRAAQLFRKRTTSPQQQQAPSQNSGKSTVLVPPPEPAKSVMPAGNAFLSQDRKLSLPTVQPIRVQAWVVMLSFKMRSTPEATGSGGASDMEIYDACIEDVNGAVVERLNISRTRDSFKLSAPSGSFNAELVPDPDSRTGIISVAGASHSYTLQKASDGDSCMLQMTRMR